MDFILVFMGVPVFSILLVLFIYWAMDRLEYLIQRRHDRYWDEREGKINKKSTHHVSYARIINPAPELPVPSSGHEECGGKFCELRGCAIIGSCQRID